MSDGFKVAEALASEITNLLDLPAAANYFVPLEAKEKELKVVVSYAGESTSFIDRAGNQKQYTIEVAVIKGVLKRDDPEEIDAVVQHCDQIKYLFEEEDETDEDMLRGALRQKKLHNATWVETEHEPILLPEKLVGAKTLACIPTLTFQRITT